MSEAAAAAAAPARLAAHDRDLLVELLGFHAEGIDEYYVRHLDEQGLQLGWGRLIGAGYVGVYRERSRPVSLWLTSAGEAYALTEALLTRAKGTRAARSPNGTRSSARGSGTSRGRRPSAG